MKKVVLLLLFRVVSLIAQQPAGHIVSGPILPSICSWFSGDVFFLANPINSSNNGLYLCGSNGIFSIGLLGTVPTTGITGVPANSVLGNNTGSIANAIALTPAQVSSLVGVVLPTSTFSSLPVSPATNTVYKVTDIGINGSEWIFNGTKWGLVNGSTVLAQSSMPFVSLSSGSVSSTGAISGITALPLAYPKAWVFLPANIVAASSAAGWYYATFSGTSAGTVYLNQPAVTFPLIWPASPTAVTAGQGAFTGPGGYVAEQLPYVTLPGNSMGINGRLAMQFHSDVTNNSNPKYAGLTLNSYPTLAYIGNTTGPSIDGTAVIQNAGSVNVQLATGSFPPSGTAGTPTAKYTQDTTTGLPAGAYMQQATATDNQVLVNFTITLYNDGQ